ncbi:MAG: sodium/substrate symporter small subunit [Hyphomicrobium sp.]
MSTDEVAGASRPTRRLTGLSLAAWAFVSFALPLAALTLNVFKIVGFPLGFWFTAQGALVALVAIAWLFTWRAGGDRGAEGILASLVFAGEAIGSAGFIGYAGLIAALGFDALSYPLGVVSGLALMTILIAPRFALYPVSTVAGFFSARFGGLWPRRVALAALGVASVLLLAADVRGAGLAIQALSGLDRATSFALVPVVLSVSWFSLALAGRRRPIGVVFAILLSVFSLMLIVFTMLQHRLPLPYWSYGIALQDVANLEISLIGRRLADVSALKPMASPFLQLSNLNFAGLVLAMALGVAVLPQLLGRHISRAAVAPGEAPRRVSIALTLVAVFMCGLAPFAVFARVALAELVQSGVKVAEAPAPITQSSGNGWISVCGEQSASAADLAAACAKSSGHKGLLRLQDLRFDNDAYVFAASRIGGLPDVLWFGLSGAALLAALVAGHALLAGFLAADAEARHLGPPETDRLDTRSVALGVLLLLAAVTMAAFSPADIVSLASEGLALIAASIFPPLLLGLFWRRFGAPGAVATLVTGFVAAGVYIFGIRFAPTLMFDLTGHLSTASPSAVSRFPELRAALDAATDPATLIHAQTALYEQAASVANWWGLRPASAVLFAVPASFLAGIAVTLVTARRGVQT